MKALKIALLGATVLISGSFAANAADVYGRASMKDAPEYIPSISWTGFYLGVHGGGAFSDGAELSWNGGYDEVEIDNSYLLGGHLGYNMQTSGNLVLGLEGDISHSNADFTSFVGTLRGRVGVAMNSTLLYATGGVAYADWDDAPLDSSVGWVVGAGLEHKLTNNLSVGAESLYYSFEDDYDDRGTVDVERDFVAVRARLTYHFGGRDALK